MNPIRALYIASFVIALSASFAVILWTKELTSSEERGDVTFETPYRADTAAEARPGTFNYDLFEVFRTMNATANWTNPDPGHRMIPNFFPRQIVISPNDVVLATQTDVSRPKLENLMTQAKRWGGAVSAALYIKGEDGINSLKEFLSDNAKKTLLRNIGIHVMLDLPNSLGYPHNFLRNLAMDNLGSDFFLALDVDFMPPRTSHERLMGLIEKTDSEIRREMKKNRLFVLPAFQILAKEKEIMATPDMIPESKTDLLDMVLDERAFGFDMIWHPCGHRPTDFVRWFDKTGESETSFYDIEYKSSFEPYVVGYRPGIPRYSTSFRGYGRDKLSFFYELHRAGYSFAVLRDLYVVHLEHPTNLNLEEKDRNMKKYITFCAYLDGKYNKTGIEPKYTCDIRGWSRVLAQIRTKNGKRKYKRSPTESEDRGDGMLENPHLANTANVTTFNELFEVFRTMNSTANWTDPDPGHRMIPNFFPRQIVTSPNDVVLATQTDVSEAKLETLMTQAKQWGGAVSAALYIKGEDGINSLEEFLSNNNTLLRNIGIHVMLDLPNSLGYPHNFLRNLAMDNLGSDFFLALDVDFVPPRNSHERLMGLIEETDSEIRREMKKKRLFVLPAFQIRAKENKTLATPDMIPKSKTDLLDMVLDQRAFGFAMDIFPCGHRPTDFVRWFDKTGESETSFYDIDYKISFEPYVVGYRPGIPRYYTSIRGYGFNKLSFFYELHRAGYSFAVLRDLYVVHLEHPTNLNLEENARNKKNFKKFLAYLDGKYNKTGIKPKYGCTKKGWLQVIRTLWVEYNHSQTTFMGPTKEKLVAQEQAAHLF